MSLLQTLKIECFTENTLMVSFHCTHYLVSMFQLRSSLKVSADCYIRNFNFEPMLTLHARIHTLLCVDIMTREKGFDLSFSRFALIVLKESTSWVWH